MSRKATTHRRRVRCEVPGCTAFARSGQPFCHAHRNTPPDPTVDDLPFEARVMLAEGEAKQRRRDEFRSRLDAGDYRGLFGPTISQMIDQAAKENGVDTELGALRYVLARAMVEIEDAEDQARVVAMVTSAIARLMRTQHLISGQLVSTVSAAVMRLLEDIDGEQ